MNYYLSVRKPSRQWRRSLQQKLAPHPLTAHPPFSMATLQLSSRSLDMCLLAVCSCALSLMCHQTSGLVNLPSVTASTATGSASSGAAQVDFVVKAGLVTSRQEVKQDKEQNA
ncbi:MAG: hypothetical protein VKJ64_10455 [Leptolyngbyaceae bacterium]|nr:hypothetical protein [Leptolyngbyaceae bacterium]